MWHVYMYPWRGNGILKRDYYSCSMDQNLMKRTAPGNDDSITHANDMTDSTINS